MNKPEEIQNDERCVVCGAYCPEGAWICPSCQQINCFIELPNNTPKKEGFFSKIHKKISSFNKSKE